MSFLLGADFASSSENESDEDDAVVIQTSQESKTKRRRLEHVLPSFDSVLSSVSASTASFLPPKFSATAQNTIESFDLVKDQERQERKQRVLGDVQETREEKQKVAAEKVGDDRKRRLRLEGAGIRESLPKREKKAAKERVKNQRLKGQSGIGSDFRGWKSETEMALRQQFD
ncbi:uncharacterized protein PHALS_09998 [Plasmopara halstedii]|uniref:Uncharacterized protein n=1 Tax=Plasmopara halstedii TaxID=4781 RepID=A0A0P1AG28_PLAHL|nr:uncharacterized protein PHALS_09998 [Plasmopara halstedii]CEG39762.1 hypothetical protein PHALS_09998 [Plasmopara halstedii]|eukprot:XP_024576131.1 hypothetical protein PHALS_09998 [Plasmopara halstedii]